MQDRAVDERAGQVMEPAKAMNLAKARQQDKALPQDDVTPDESARHAAAEPTATEPAATVPAKVEPKERPAASAQMKADLIAVIPNLRAFAVSLCGNPDRADDLVQETLVKAWSNLGSFVEGTNLPAWLFTILRNIYYSEYRKRRREVADTDGAIAAKLAAAPAQHGHMDFQDFRSALQRLPVDQREALILIGASGLSYEEAANVCNCAVGTMKSRVNRARNRLSDMLSLQASGEFGNDGDWQAIDPIFLGQRFSRTSGD